MSKTQKLRRWMLVLAVLAVMGVFVSRLMQIQIVESEYYQKMLEGQYFSTQTVKATRGEIVDSSGEHLALNRMGYDVVFDKAFFPDEEQNEIIAALIQMFESLGEEWTDNLPMRKYAPYDFLEGYEGAVERLKDFLGVASYTSSEDTLYWLADRYGLQDYSASQQRKIASVRYEMEQRGFAFNVPYTFAADIDITTVVQVKERSHYLLGVDVVESAVRGYPLGTTAPHIIGTIGPIYGMDEYNALKEKGYAMDDILGKSGVELSFENFLRGINGKREIRINARGDVISAVETEPPTPGNTVVLTLDGDLQRFAQQALENQILNLQQTASAGAGREANAGAVVILQPKTGQVLAAATYPSYDLGTYRQEYANLVSDTEGTPLVNRAVMGQYVPGSTFKPVVATGGLAAGIIANADTVNCTRVYTFYNDYQPTCMSYHGNLNVIGALQVSCNIFFYDVGRRLGIDGICAIASQYGLGQPTGIEIPENIGSLSNPEVNAAKSSEPWYPGHVLQSSIGQLYNEYTPLQMANYAATIGNRGQRMKLTIVKEIRDYSMETVVVPFSAEVADTVSASRADIEAVVSGMVAASRSGTAASWFGNYPIDIASKTGSPQTSTELLNSVFICFAPAQNPEIAMAVIIEKGYHGYTGAPVAKEILDYYFGYGAYAPEPRYTSDSTTSQEDTSMQNQPMSSATEQAQSQTREGSEGSQHQEDEGLRFPSAPEEDADTGLRMN